MSSTAFSEVKMAILEGVLYDGQGNRLPTSEEKLIAKEMFLDFAEKHKDRFNDWLRAHGPVAFPIKFDLDKMCWYWTGD